jgi:hypothetical protein
MCVKMCASKLHFYDLRKLKYLILAKNILPDMKNKISHHSNGVTRLVLVNYSLYIHTYAELILSHWS